MTEHRGLTIDGSEPAMEGRVRRHAGHSIRRPRRRFRFAARPRTAAVDPVQSRRDPARAHQPSIPSMPSRPLPKTEPDPAAAPESPACPLCSADDPAASRYRFPPYAVVRCRGCRLWYLRPRLAEPAMLSGYADDAYFEGGGSGYSSYRAQEATLRRTFRRLLRELTRRGMTGGRLLEVGCAYGFFLDEARGLFAERLGTEYSPAAADRCRSRADRVLLGGLDRLAPDERFDLAACIHVIEHVYHPVDFLRRLRGHVEPGGRVVLATPDMGGPWRPLLRRRWPFFKIPEHVTYFDRRTLPRLLADAGFDEVGEIPYPSYFSLSLIGEKLALRVPAALSGLQLRVPATTVAFAGRAP
jgi:SAM-dependent methyltransferase